MPEFARLSHEGQNVHAVFKRWTLNFCTRAVYAPAEPLTLVFVYYFRRRKIGSP